MNQSSGRWGDGVVAIVQKILLKMVRVPYPLTMSPAHAPEYLVCVL